MEKMKVVNIREFDWERDMEVVEKLERELEIGSRKGFSILTNMLGDPLCRVRLYPNHVMLVAELAGGRRVVGVVRGCIKSVVVGGRGGSVKVGCVLGLRVSPKHRRMGIGSKLVKSVEEWFTNNGAEYIFLAVEKNNTASINLFVHKCNYMKLCSLFIVAQPILDHNTTKFPSSNIKIKKLNTKCAISLYKDRLGGIAFFPLDIDAILNNRLSLGTWVSYFEQDQWSGLNEQEEEDDDENEFISRTPSSWVMISIWKTCESYKLQVRGPPILGCLHAALGHIGAKMLPCLKVVLPSLELFSSSPFGFLFLYGIHGEGERVGELLGSLWNFACKMGGSFKDCKLVVSELGVGDPMRGYVPWESSTSRIDDVWFLKRINNSNGSSRTIIVDSDTVVQSFSRIFIDPRDF